MQITSFFLSLVVLGSDGGGDLGLTGFETLDLLGLNRNTLRKKIRDLEIKVIRTPAA